MNETTLARSTVPELPLLARGKVRDIHDLGKLVGLELGGATLLGVLAASASYIAAASPDADSRTCFCAKAMMSF